MPPEAGPFFPTSQITDPFTARPPKKSYLIALVSMQHKKLLLSLWSQGLPWSDVPPTSKIQQFCQYWEWRKLTVQLNCLLIVKQESLEILSLQHLVYPYNPKLMLAYMYFKTSSRTSPHWVQCVPPCIGNHAKSLGYKNNSVKNKATCIKVFHGTCEFHGKLSMHQPIPFSNMITIRWGKRVISSLS